MPYPVNAAASVGVRVAWAPSAVAPVTARVPPTPTVLACPFIARTDAPSERSISQDRLLLLSVEIMTLADVPVMDALSRLAVPPFAAWGLLMIPENVLVPVTERVPVVESAVVVKATESQVFAVLSICRKVDMAVSASFTSLNAIDSPSTPTSHRELFAVTPDSMKVVVGFVPD